MTHSTTQVLRQGDVLLIESRRRPSSSAARITDQGRVILAYGEVTGHAHEVIAPVIPDPDPVPPAELFEEPDGTRLLVIRRPVSLTHQEHDPIALDGGCTYEVRRQCEWSLDDVRAVAD